jgi:hypothetical protein
MTNNSSRYYLTTFLSFLLIVSVLALQIQIINATSKSPYDSGYDHGCDDVDIFDPDDRYINQPGKGPGFHTDEFMRGYNDGYNACWSGSSNFDIGDGTDGCFNEGYEDGSDEPFDIDNYDKCGGSSGGPGNNEYYNGFIAGCLSVKGNTAENCEKSTDS